MQAMRSACSIYMKFLWPTISYAISLAVSLAVPSRKEECDLWGFLNYCQQCLYTSKVPAKLHRRFIFISVHHALQWEDSLLIFCYENTVVRCVFLVALWQVVDTRDQRLLGGSWIQVHPRLDQGDAKHPVKWKRQGIQCQSRCEIWRIAAFQSRRCLERLRRWSCKHLAGSRCLLLCKYDGTWSLSVPPDN